jgi:actin-related protein 8
MINQKNYYTEFLKREEQYLAFRAPQEEATARMVQAARDKDRALAFGAPPEGAEDENEEGTAEDAVVTSMQADPSKLIVLHCGSQNLRIGLGTDALPRTVPMVIARRWKEAECEENNGEPCPKRQKVDGAVPASALPEKWFGEDVRVHLHFPPLRRKG